MELLQQQVLLLGDIHGGFYQLALRLESLDIRDSLIVCVGDFGVGFVCSKAEKQVEVKRLEDLNRYLIIRNNTLITIRGNHDDPAYFIDGENKLTFSNIELLEDYTVRTINGETWQFVGGAHSIDRLSRKYRMARFNTVEWWEDEVFVLNPQKAVHCDVLVTHSAPTWNGRCSKDNIEHECNEDETLFPQLMEERRAHDELIRLCKPLKHYCGHFHYPSSVVVNECASRILDIFEFVEHTNYNSNKWENILR